MSWFYHNDFLYVLCAVPSATSLTCLNRHGFMLYTLVGLILHAVKCQATSSDRYVTINPSARYIRPTMGSISIAEKYIT